MAGGSETEDSTHLQHTFHYLPFSDDQSIRVLTLQPGSGDDPLVGSLSSEQLDSAAAYDAISYVWGTGSRRFELLCDGRVLPLTASIHDALRRVRMRDEPRRLWADQICINQGDVAERSQQVRLMNAIYKGASRIVVWLGPDEDGVAEQAVRLVHRLHDVFADEKAHATFKKAHSEDLGKQSRGDWEPLAKLTKLTWVSPSQL